MLTTIITNCISKFLAASGSERETHLRACNYNASEETWFRFINPLLLLFLSRKCKSKNPHLKSPLLKLEHDHHYFACSFFLEQSSLASLLNEDVSEGLDIFVSVFRTPRGSVFARIFEFWPSTKSDSGIRKVAIAFLISNDFDSNSRGYLTSRMCFSFPFFQARSCNSVEKVDKWCFPFFLRFLLCINLFFLAKKFLCICHPLSPHKFSDCSLQESDRCPEEIMRTTCCDVNR